MLYSIIQYINYKTFKPDNNQLTNNTFQEFFLIESEGIPMFFQSAQAVVEDYKLQEVLPPIQITSPFQLKSYWKDTSNDFSLLGITINNKNDSFKLNIQSVYLDISSSTKSIKDSDPGKLYK